VGAASLPSSCAPAASSPLALRTAWRPLLALLPPPAAVCQPVLQLPTLAAPQSLPASGVPRLPSPPLLPSSIFASVPERDGAAPAVVASGLPPTACHHCSLRELDSCPLLLLPGCLGAAAAAPGPDSRALAAPLPAAEPQPPAAEAAGWRATERTVDARLDLTVCDSCETAATAALTAAPAAADTPFFSVALKPARRFSPTRDLAPFHNSIGVCVACCGHSKPRHGVEAA
jgi:hypothetical protein